MSLMTAICDPQHMATPSCLQSPISSSTPYQPQAPTVRNDRGGEILILQFPSPSPPLPASPPSLSPSIPPLSPIPT